ncbi:MAG: NADH-quinone oxidoreductase subunit L [Actinobacteria bacterium]|nr:NADH-quinone oxidoreductase subunit L [Actinomycetota bacterium]
MAGSFAVSVLVLVDLLAFGAEERTHLVEVYRWIASGSFEVPVQLRVDPLSVVMALTVSGVGALIHVYSVGYMHGDPRYARFFAYLNLFVFFMLTLVLADNFLLMFVGWEGVGLCSYLLIGFWFERPAAADAAKKAFIVTRIGDTAMLIGIALIFVHVGSLGFGDVFGHRAISGTTATIVALLLFAGAVGKSAQVPLHTWLPDAMEGPTPVSALIHAATMVTAGVYLVVRTHPIFEASDVALTVVLVVGLVTAIYAGTAALAQDDFKRVLAYSTISQLGYMFFAAGMGAYAAAIFLLVAHAFFKAVMFLGAGSVMHGLHDETDVTRMGGLRRAMPLTFATFVLGWLAISGIPPFSGFFAKDQILAVANETGRTLAWIAALAGAFLTALYMSRLAFLAFFGEPRHEHRPHESPPAMTVPMLVLGGLALVGGVLGLTATGGLLPRFLEPVSGGPHEAHGGLPEWALIAISVATALLGIALAWYVYGSGRFDWAALRVRFAGGKRFLERGWYLDDAYGAVLVTPGKAVSAFSAYVVDQRVVDGAVNGMGRLFATLAAAGRRVQTGYVRNYALAFLLGVVAILLYVAVRL